MRHHTPVLAFYVAVAFGAGLLVSPMALRALRGALIKIPPQPKDDVVFVN